MLIAKIENGAVVDVADHLSMFPNTSFSANGVHDSFYAENSLAPVSVFKPYDHATEQLVPCEPYLEDGVAYTVRVEPLPVTIEDLGIELNVELGVDSVTAA